MLGGAFAGICSNSNSLQSDLVQMSSANKRQASASESDSVNLPEDVLALNSIFKYNENNYDSYPSSPKRKKAKIATSGSASKPLPNSSSGSYSTLYIICSRH